MPAPPIATISAMGAKDDESWLDYWVFDMIFLASYLTVFAAFSWSFFRLNSISFLYLISNCFFSYAPSSTVALLCFDFISNSSLSLLLSFCWAEYCSRYCFSFSSYSLFLTSSSARLANTSFARSSCFSSYFSLSCYAICCLSAFSLSPNSLILTLSYSSI